MLKIKELFNADTAAHARGDRKRAPIAQTPKIEELGKIDEGFKASKPFSF